MPSCVQRQNKLGAASGGILSLGSLSEVARLGRRDFVRGPCYHGAGGKPDEDDPKLREMLTRLARPALGNWWEFVRRLVPVLAESGDAQFAQLQRTLLGRARSDLPACTTLSDALGNHSPSKRQARSTVRLTELFDQLVKYRNDQIGHGALGQQADSTYERMGGLLLAAATELLHTIDPMAGRSLHFVADVRRLGDGGWLVDRFELKAESARRIHSVELPSQTELTSLPKPRMIYLAPSAESSPSAGVGMELRLQQLHPLVRFDEETHEVFFLNARRKARQAEYLCYSTGRVLQGVKLVTDQRELLARALVQPVDESAVDHWAAESLSDEPPTPSVPVVSKSIGEFEILSRIGCGGMGVVYRAWQPSLGRQVALKCLLRTGDRKSEARFAREIRALGQVDHPHLVKIYTSGVSEDQWFYAMEVIEGADLSGVCALLAGASASEVGLPQWNKAVDGAAEHARRQEESLHDEVEIGGTPDHASPTEPSPQRVADLTRQGGESSPLTTRGHVVHIVKIIRQVAQAAHALHRENIIHRDIKPGNIMISANGGYAVLMDLGLAQLVDETEGRLTRTRQFLGTLRYASPEQVLAVDRMDARSDVYSLGATMWEALSLRPLFDATEDTPSPELMQRIQVTDPPPPGRYNPHIPKDLNAIVLRCLEKDPARRYDSAADLDADLSRFLAGEPVVARPVGQFERAWRWTRRNSKVAALLSLIALSLVGGMMTSTIFALTARERAREAVAAQGETEQQKQVAEQRRIEAERRKTHRLRPLPWPRPSRTKRDKSSSTNSLAAASWNSRTAASKKQRPTSRPRMSNARNCRRRCAMPAEGCCLSFRCSNPCGNWSPSKKSCKDTPRRFKPRDSAPMVNGYSPPAPIEPVNCGTGNTAADWNALSTSTKTLSPTHAFCQETAWRPPVLIAR